MYHTGGDADSEGGSACVRIESIVKSLYFLFNFAVNLKLCLKKSIKLFFL